MTNFIHQQYLEDLSICDKLVAFHQMNPNKTEGKSGGKVQTEIKKSTDCELTVFPELRDEYFAQLLKVSNAYIEKFPACNATGSAWKIKDGVNVQHYAPSEAYYGWHCERTNTKQPNVTRHLVFMTYLNDLDDDGETEFLHQELKIKPRKGLTLIWPADWTHTHRGIPSKTQDKYIVTGWYNFIEERNEPPSID